MAHLTVEQRMKECSHFASNGQYEVAKVIIIVTIIS